MSMNNNNNNNNNNGEKRGLFGNGLPWNIEDDDRTIIQKKTSPSPKTTQNNKAAWILGKTDEEREMEEFREWKRGQTEKSKMERLEEEIRLLRNQNKKRGQSSIYGEDEWTSPSTTRTTTSKPKLDLSSKSSVIEIEEGDEKEWDFFNNRRMESSKQEEDEEERLTKKKSPSPKPTVTSSRPSSTTSSRVKKVACETGVIPIKEREGRKKKLMLDQYILKGKGKGILEIFGGQKQDFSKYIQLSGEWGNSKDILVRANINQGGTSGEFQGEEVPLYGLSLEMAKDNGVRDTSMEKLGKESVDGVTIWLCITSHSMKMKYGNEWPSIEEGGIEQVAKSGTPSIATKGNVFFMHSISLRDKNNKSDKVSYPKLEYEFGKTKDPMENSEFDLGCLKKFGCINDKGEGKGKLCSNCSAFCMEFKRHSANDNFEEFKAFVQNHECERLFD